MANNQWQENIGSLLTASGTTADSAITDPTQTASQIAALKGLLSSAIIKNLVVDANGAGTVQDLIQYFTLQGKAFTASTGSQASAAQTSGVALFNASNSGKSILVYRIHLMNSGSAQNALTEVRKITSNPSYSSSVTPVNNNFGSATTSVATATYQASATPTGTVLDQSNMNNLSTQELLTDKRCYYLPNGTASGLSIYIAQGATGGLWSASISYVEF